MARGGKAARAGGGLLLLALALLLAGCPSSPARRDDDTGGGGGVTKGPVRRADPRQAPAESLAEGNLTVGAELYTLKCEGCHGTVTAPRGQVLFDLDWHDERRVDAVRAIIVDGLGEQMPAFGNRLPERQIVDVMAWLANARRLHTERVRRLETVPPTP